MLQSRVVQVKPRCQRGTRYSNKDGHVADTTPPPADGDITNAQENWESRYLGLQKVIAKRDTDLNTKQAELDALRAEHEAANTELAERRQRDVDTSEEDAARQQFEQLRERFDPAPTPIGNSPARDWLSGSEDAGYAQRERSGDSSTSWPTS